MQPPKIPAAPWRSSPRSLPLILPALLFLLAGCSRQVETFVGNERLIRGPQGLGTTSQFDPVPDQDTYMAPDSAVLSTTLLVGQSGTFQARIFMDVSTWTLPDSSLAGFAADSVFFQMDQDTMLIPPPLVDLFLQLSQTTSSWDYSSAWPGPSAGATLGSTTYDFVGPLRINMGLGGYTLIKSWAADPSLLPGLTLQAPGGTAVGAFRALTGTFQIYYHYTSATSLVSATAVSRVTENIYLNSPVAPAPTGADTSLMLGGGYQAAVAIRVPLSPSVAGFSLNEGRLVLHVNSTFPAVDGSVFKEGTGLTDPARVDVNIDARRIRSAWTEATTDVQSLNADLLPFTILLDRVPVAGDSLSIPIPHFIVREWSDSPSTNYGMLVTIRSANVNPGLFVASRESANPPVLRLAYTSPPPWRW